MIEIRKNPFGDTRTCNVTQVKWNKFIMANHSHIGDVCAGLTFFAQLLKYRGPIHDWDKVRSNEAAEFFIDFKHKFAEGYTKWWDNHRKIHRHHLAYEDGIPEDVNLVDVIEYIVDCVMAGLARSGEVYEIKLPDEVLRRAFNNTIELLKNEVVVKEE